MSICVLLQQKVEGTLMLCIAVGSCQITALKIRINLGGFLALELRRLVATDLFE